MGPETLPHPRVRVIGMNMDMLIDDRLTDEEQALVDAYDEEELLMSAGLGHLDLMVRIYQGLLAHFADRTDVFVCADLTWFDPRGRAMAPDIAVVFGVPQRPLQSYRQDKGMPPAAVVIELVSPQDTPDRNRAKIERWSEAGAEELWLLDTRTGQVSGFSRFAKGLRFDPDLGVTSQRLGGIHFSTEADGTIVPYFPDGTPFPADLAGVVRELQANRAEVRAAQAAVRAAQAAAAAAVHKVEALETQLRALGIEPAS